MKVRHGFVANSSSSSFIVFAALSDNDVVDLLNSTSTNMNNQLSFINRAKKTIINKVTINKNNNKHIVPTDEYNLTPRNSDSMAELVNNIDTVISMTKRLIVINNDDELLEEIDKFYRDHSILSSPSYAVDSEDDDCNVTPISSDQDRWIENEDQELKSTIAHVYTSLLGEINDKNYSYPIYLDMHLYEEPEGYGILYGPMDDTSYDLVSAYCGKKKIPVIERCISMFNQLVLLVQIDAPQCV